MKKILLALLISLLLAAPLGASQNTLVVADGTGLQVRTGFNNALNTLVSLNAGPSAPTATYAYMLWADTTNNLLKMRDAGNANWITLGTLGTANLGLQTAIPTGAATQVWRGDQTWVAPWLPGYFSNLAIYSDATTPNTKIDLTADVVVTSSGAAFNPSQGVSVTIDGTTTGANGLDTGSLSASTSYYVYVIYNPTTAATAGLVSTSASSPTLPSGYTFKRWVGFARTDASAHFLPFWQQDRKYTYRAYQLALNGASGTGSYQSLSLANLVPAAASHVLLSYYLNPATGSPLFYLSCDGSNNFYFAQTTSTAYATGQIEMPLATAPTVWWNVTSNGAWLSLYVEGFRLKL